MKKRPYKKNTVTLNLKKDLNLRHDIDVEFWEDPSQQVVFDLLNIIGTAYFKVDDEEEDRTEEQIEQLNIMNKRYFECVSHILVDCNIEGIGFGTPESTEESFYDERIAWGAFHQGVIAYMSRLIDEYGLLKKALARVKDLSNSGEENEQNED